MVENIQKELLEAQPYVRSLRMASNSRGSHQTSESGRGLLSGSLPTAVQVMPHAQECQGEGWYDDASWTWGDYFDDLAYISYDIQYESKSNSIVRG
jgi:hypothetical protein